MFLVLVSFFTVFTAVITLTLRYYVGAADNDSNVFTDEPQCPDVEVAHASLAVVRLVVAALVRVDDSVVTTFDLNAFTRLGAQVRVLTQPFVRPCHQHAAQSQLITQLIVNLLSYLALSPPPACSCTVAAQRVARLLL